MTKNPWLILAVLFFARTTMGFQFQSVGSIAPVLVDALEFDFVAVGALIGLYLFPGIFIALPGGMLGAKFGGKRITIVGLFLMAVGGLLMAAGDAYPLLATGRTIAGTGAVLMNVMLTKMVSDWFGERNLSTAMAVLVASWPFGIALGLVGFLPMVRAFGMHSVWIAGAIASMTVAAAVALIYRDPPQPDETAGPVPLRVKLAPREWWLGSVAGVVWGTYNVAFILGVTHFPSLFATRGLDLAQANALSSWLGWALILFIPIGGIIADRTGRPNAVMHGAFAVAGAAIALMCMPTAPTITLFVVVAAIIGLPAGPIMALPAKATEPAHRAVGMGVYFTWYYVLMAALPVLAGYARDVSQTPVAPLLVSVAMLIAASAGVVLFQRTVENEKLRRFGIAG